MKTLMTLVAVLGLCSVGRGEWIVNSPYDDGIGPGIGGNTKHAVQFTLASPTIIEAIEGRVYASSVTPSNQIVAAIYSNGDDDFPLTELMSGDFFVPTSPPEPAPFDYAWRGITDLQWQLVPGTYWAVFHNFQDFNGGIQSIQPNSQSPKPLDRFAIYTAYDPTDPNVIGWTNLYETYGVKSLGIRVSGHSVPEPKSILIFAAGIARVVMRKRLTD